MVQISHPYITTGKTISLTKQIFVSKVMSLLLNTLSRFVITFFTRRKHLLNLMPAVTAHSDFRDQENKICHCFHIFPFYFLWSDGTRCHDLSFFKHWVLSQLFSLFSLTLISNYLLPLYFVPLKWYHHLYFWATSLNLPANAGDTYSIPGSERLPDGGNGSPLQYSCLENSHG